MGFDRHEDCYLMLEVEFDHLQFTSQYLQNCLATIEGMYDPYQSSLQSEPAQPEKDPEAVASKETPAAN